MYTDQRTRHLQEGEVFVDETEVKSFGFIPIDFDDIDASKSIVVDLINNRGVI